MLEEALALVRSTAAVSPPRVGSCSAPCSPSGGHRTAEELAGEVQAQGARRHISTIYRNLEELERLGVIVHSHLGHGPATYHLASHPRPLRLRGLRVR